MRRPRPRFWAWTLTLTAALLAVVWVGSMKFEVEVAVHPSTSFRCMRGTFAVVRYGQNYQNGEKGYIAEHDRWNADWWFSAFKLVDYLGIPYCAIWCIPLWPFVLLTGVPGVWMLIKTRKRTNPHACPACGYDRTGLPQSSTGPAACPECGPECGKGKDENR